MDKKCTHINLINPDISTPKFECEECVSRGGHSWQKLRQCLVCGHVGCDETSPGKHAQEHFQKTGHPLIRSVGEYPNTFKYCLADKINL